MYTEVYKNNRLGTISYSEVYESKNLKTSGSVTISVYFTGKTGAKYYLPIIFLLPINNLQKN